MKSQERSDLLAAIASFCDQQAHWRLGQLIANVAGWADEEIWDVEDEPFLAAANSHHSQAQPLQVVGPGHIRRAG
ncbi:MAG: hypothetical protein U0744_09980 [Gemmataceae bacterium]